MSDPIKINKVTYGGNVGEFRGNGEVIGWKGEDGMVIHEVGNVTQAAWFEGELRIAIEGSDMMKLTGFRPQDFETLWAHFAEFNVHIKKHTRTTTLSKEDFDGAMERLSKSADLVDDAKSGSVQKKSTEFNLLKAVEAMRDGLHEAVKGDKNALSNVFAANNCERIGKLRLIINTVQLEVYQTDQRWVDLRNMAATIQSVLFELGTFVRWHPPEYAEHAANSGMSKRQMMWELKCKQNPDLNPDDFEAEVEILDSPTKTRPVKSAAANPLASDPLARGPNPNAFLEGLKNTQQRQSLQTFEAGEYVEGKYCDGEWYDARIMKAYDNGTYEIRWQDGSPYDTNKTPNDLRKKEGGGYENPELSAPPAPVPPAAEEGSDDDAAVDNGKKEIQTDRPDQEPVTPIEERKQREKGENKRLYYIRSDSIIEGWVWKRSRYLKNWRRRWLVLTNNGLDTYKERSPGIRATEYIDRSTFQRIYNADGEVSMARCFCVCSSHTFGSRNFYMVCDDEAQKNQWLTLIQQKLGRR